jgi:hypothetical protein
MPYNHTLFYNSFNSPSKERGGYIPKCETVVTPLILSTFRSDVLAGAHVYSQR